jgi:hypothetical protein
MGWWSRLFGGKSGSASSTGQAQAAQARREPAMAPVPAPVGGHPSIDERAALELREGSPEFDEFIARAELESGSNLPHGAEHLANLLIVDPAHPRWRELLQRYLAAAAEAPERLVAAGEQRHASTEALRAWIRHAQGRHDDAVSLLVDVARALRSADLLHAWALDWLEPAGRIEGLVEETGLRMFGCLVSFTGEAPQASARQLASVRRWSALLERVAPAWQDSSLLLLTRAALLRKSGRFAEALALAGPLDQARDYNRVVAIAMALRANGRFVESAQAFEHGAPLEADGVSAWLEAGDSWLAAQRWHEAAAAYDQALARQPGQEWAAPSAAYCRWKIDGGDPWTQAVGEALKSGNERARELLFRDFGAIEQSRDASAGVLRQMRAKWLETPSARPGDGLSRLSVSTVEAPSARLAIELELAAFGLPPRIEMIYGGVPAHDPRVAVADVAYTLWRWNGLHAAPGLPAPPGEVAALVAGLASQRYEPWVNWAQASHVAARLGPAATADILAVMVHPPALPAGANALDWLPRVQLAAAMVAAQVDDGWEGSRRRAALHALLLGPSDWATVAGIRALGWVARTEPACAQDIHRLFEERERHLPTEGHWDWVAVLYAEWQQLPWLFDRERDALKARLAALE